MTRLWRTLTGAFVCVHLIVPLAYGSEIIPETPANAIVRLHPRTGEPYVSIVESGNPDARNPFAGAKKFKRPDYRMLDAKVKSGDISYDGPSSDRWKVYVLAASLATAGTVGGAVGFATAPAAAAGTGSGAGAGAFLATGAAVAGTASAAATKFTGSSERDRFIHTSESHTIEQNNSSKGALK